LFLYNSILVRLVCGAILGPSHRPPTCCCGATQTPAHPSRSAGGDLGAIIALHGRLITGEYGLDSTHEGYAAASVAEQAIRGWPGERESAWIVECDGEGGVRIGRVPEAPIQRYRTPLHWDTELGMRVR
jgi:hypothetical protein